ncbi:MAG: MATE family efflux transporter [Bacteroidota bacterium]
MKAILTRKKMGGVRELFVLALPIVISQSSETLMVFTDRVFLSRLGADNMNAATAGGITAFMLITFFFGLIGFSTALIAQYYGSKKYENCPRVTVQALGISTLAYPIILACIPLVFWFFSSTVVSESQLILQKQYLKILAFGSIISLFRHTISCYFSGIGRTQIVMISALVTLSINVVVNYILIFGKLGIPALGIEGAAYGTIISALCGLIVLLYYFFRSDNAQKFFVHKAFRFHAQITKTLFRYGSPAGIEFFGNLVAFSVLVSIFHSYNEVTATAASIMFNWDMVTFVPLTGIEVGVTSLVGRYIGANKFYVAERAAYSGVKLGFFFSFIVAITFIAIPGVLVDVFRPIGEDPVFVQSRPLAMTMLQLAAIYVLAESLLVAFVGALRGAGDTIWTMWASMILHWLFVPALYLSLFVFDIGPVKAWGILVVFFLCFSFMFYFRFKGGAWKRISVIEKGD